MTEMFTFKVYTYCAPLDSSKPEEIEWFKLIDFESNTLQVFCDFEDIASNHSIYTSLFLESDIGLHITKYDEILN